MENVYTVLMHIYLGNYIKFNHYSLVCWRVCRNNIHCSRREYKCNTISSQSPDFCRRHYQKHWSVFFWTQCIYTPTLAQRVDSPN